MQRIFCARRSSSLLLLWNFSRFPSCATRLCEHLHRLSGIDIGGPDRLQLGRQYRAREAELFRSILPKENAIAVRLPTLSACALVSLPGGAVIHIIGINPSPLCPRPTSSHRNMSRHGFFVGSRGCTLSKLLSSAIATKTHEPPSRGKRCHAIQRISGQASTFMT